MNTIIHQHIILKGRSAELFKYFDCNTFVCECNLLYERLKGRGVGERERGMKVKKVRVEGRRTRRQKTQEGE